MSDARYNIVSIRLFLLCLMISSFVAVFSASAKAKDTVSVSKKPFVDLNNIGLHQGQPIHLDIGLSVKRTESIYFSETESLNLSYIINDKSLKEHTVISIDGLVVNGKKYSSETKAFKAFEATVEGAVDIQKTFPYCLRVRPEAQCHAIGLEFLAKYRKPAGNGYVFDYASCRLDMRFNANDRTAFESTGVCKKISADKAE